MIGDVQAELATFLTDIHLTIINTTFMWGRSSHLKIRHQFCNNQSQNRQSNYNPRTTPPPNPKWQEPKIHLPIISSSSINPTFLFQEPLWPKLLRLLPPLWVITQPPCIHHHLGLLRDTIPSKLGLLEDVVFAYFSLVLSFQDVVYCTGWLVVLVEKREPPRLQVPTLIETFPNHYPSFPTILVTLKVTNHQPNLLLPRVPILLDHLVGEERCRIPRFLDGSRTRRPRVKDPRGEGRVGDDDEVLGAEPEEEERAVGSGHGGEEAVVEVVPELEPVPEDGEGGGARREGRRITSVLLVVMIA
ncbi:hypothetical protein G2W53_026021 [Senna tora]|uniref:Uncharacterized protein n=1 Tax=Senna tora TaxID=362788 RepID=A0A834WIF1_9FABA|nr:hypothetical protein G2W53_026021 [Senna tora]